jgi:hypothetical protein
LTIADRFPAYFGHPAPLHVQPVPVYVHVPSQANVHPPPEQSKVHVAPDGHHAEQSPLEQSKLQGTFGAE